MAEALFVTASSLTDDPDTLTHYLGILGEWLARDAVVGELSQVIDPRPGAELDVALLAAEFEAAGFEPDLLGEDITFERVVGRLVQAFYDAASKQPELQGQMEIGLLRGIVENTTEQVRLLRRVVSALERPEPQTQPAPVGSREGDIEVIGHFNTLITGTVIGDLQVHHGDTYELSPGPQLDPTSLRQSYLSRVLEQTQTLQLTGVDPKAAREPSAQTGLALAAVYTALLTQQTEQLERRGMPLPEREAHRLSAVAMLDREAKLALLGDPGSGKSTFVNFVALCLAGEGLGRTDANLALMTTPLPQEEERRQSQDEKPEPQPWRRGALLPVRVVLRDFAAHGLPAAGQRATGDHLWRFIVAELGETLADYAPHLKRELRERGGLILLDGLDEVPKADERRVQVKQAVQGFRRRFPALPLRRHQPHLCVSTPGLEAAGVQRGRAGPVQPGADQPVRGRLVRAHGRRTRAEPRRCAGSRNAAQGCNPPQRPVAPSGRAAAAAHVDGQPARLARGQPAGEARGALRRHGGPAAGSVGKPQSGTWAGRQAGHSSRTKPERVAER